jgi:rhodanese-related sulfurtransferase
MNFYKQGHFIVYLLPNPLRCMMKTNFLIHRTAFLLAVAAFLLVPSSGSAYKLLSPDTLSTWLTSGPPFDFLLIDVRETSEMTAIIATENCRPYHLAYNTHVFDSTVSRLPKTTAIVCYCRTGIRSGKADSILDAAGFTLVYSLSGGFTAWHGATEAFSYVKPDSDLPAPSMAGTSVRCPAVLDRSARPIRLTQKNGLLICSAPLLSPHTISILTMDGQCIEKKQDPFSNQTWYMPLSGLSHGVYAVRLESRLVRSSLIIRNIPYCQFKAF